MAREDQRNPSRRSLDPGAPDGARPERGTWRARLPELFVFLSLVGMVLLPMLAQRRIDDLRDRLSAAVEPARGHIAEVQLALALEVASRRALRLAEHDTLVTDVRTARARRRAAEGALREETAQLGDTVTAAVGVLDARLREVDAYLDTLPLTTPIATEDYARRIEAQRQRYARALAAAGVVEAALRRSGSEHRAEVVKIERRVDLMNFALAVLALVATLLVAGLRRQAEARRRDLERVTESRTRLMRGFTHDVKNPLGAADGYLALLEDGVYAPLAEKQLAAVAKGRRAIRQALDLIASLLDIARAEAGQLELHRGPADLRAIVADLADAFRAQASAKGLTLAATDGSALPPVETDAARVRQIVGNLLSNAVKYTPTGGHVRIDASVAPNGTERWAAISVADDGPGIPPDRIRTLFHEFSRLDPNAAEGAGIGLAISQRIARALGGEIDVQSRVGAGSEFTLRLPID